MSRPNHGGDCDCERCTPPPLYARRAREAEAARIDEREDPNPCETLQEGAVMARIPDVDEDPVLPYDDDLSCPCCGPEIESFDCPTCGASFMSQEDAARCCTDPHFCCMETCGEGCPAPAPTCTCMLRWYPNRCTVHPEKNQ